jgi:tol-pal system protein YbgF
LTVLKPGPYTSPVIRTFLFIAPIALFACATPGAVPPLELTELKAEMRAIREENARLEKRLERVEMHASVAPMRGSPSAAPVASKPSIKIPDPAPEAMPSLTVVKLKPRQQAAPKISTGVPIVEPAPEVIDALKSAPPEEVAEEVDAEIGDAYFEQGVTALKTGNVAGGILQLQTFASESPRHPRADNAIYFIGLGLMGLADFEGAAKNFEDVVSRYPAGDAVLESLLKLGECRVRLNKTADARVVYQKIVSSYPGTSAASAAKARLSSLTGSP